MGIFDGDLLVLCVTKRHYRASVAIELLSKRASYQGAELKIHTPHKSKHLKYYSAIEESEHALNSGSVFGANRTYAEKWAEWCDKKDIPNPIVSSAAVSVADGDVPF